MPRYASPRKFCCRVQLWSSSAGMPANGTTRTIQVMVASSDSANGASVGAIADDARALHLPVARRVVHHSIVLGAAVVPHRHTVGLPTKAHLELRNQYLADQIAEQESGAGI